VSSKKTVPPLPKVGDEWTSADFLPTRRRLRAEDIDLEPIDIEDVIVEKWSGIRRGAPHFLRLLRRNEAVLFPLAIVLGALLYFSQQHAERVERELLAAQEAHVLAKATKAVEEIRAVMGNEIRVSAVTLDRGPYFSAYWEPGVKVIAFNPDVPWTEEALLATAGHECVHALFDRHELSGYQRSLAHALIEETTASVLGAHLAGRALAARGGNGAELTRRLVEQYRLLCLTTSRANIMQRFLRRLQRNGWATFDPEEAWSIMMHFGNERLVDQVNSICLEHTDPLEAARAIAAKYKLYYKWNPAEVPEPKR
jgi:hypothetical protein